VDVKDTNNELNHVYFIEGDSPAVTPVSQEEGVSPVSTPAAGSGRQSAPPSEREKSPSLISQITDGHPAQSELAISDTEDEGVGSINEAFYSKTGFP